MSRGELQVAAHWRRILAFGFDIVAIGTIVILLLNKHFSQVSHWEGELNGAAEELQTELIRERRAHLIDVFRGRAEPEPDMVYYERVQEFLKDKRGPSGKYRSLSGIEKSRGGPTRGHPKCRRPISEREDYLGKLPIA